MSNQKTLSSYVVGFISCLLLTFVAFLLVESNLLSKTMLAFSLAFLGLFQLIVQAVCFLRLNNKAEGRWNLWPFLFTILIIVIILSGSFWIMVHLSGRMM